jgi:hypothetical protein
MRHDSLDVEQIRNLVRSNEGLAERSGFLAAMIEAIGIIVADRFVQNKKLPGKTLGHLFQRSDEIIRSKFRPLNFQQDSKPATRVHPKGEQLESCYSMLVHFPGSEGGFHDLYHLVSLRLFASRKVFRIDVITHPVAFQYHAAERILERAEDVGDAIDLLGMNISKWLPFVVEAEQSLPPDSGCCIPVEDNMGMLLGEFTDRFPSGGTSYTISRNGIRYTAIEPTGEGRRTFVARTFVSRHQLRPAQAYAMKRLSEWGRDNDFDRYDNEINILWPWSFDNDDTSDPVGLGVTAYEELEDVMSDPVFIRAMRLPGTIGSASQRSDDDLDLGDWCPGQLPEEKAARDVAPV